jgi:hypothetical protein
VGHIQWSPKRAFHQAEWIRRWRLEHLTAYSAPIRLAASPEHPEEKLGFKVIQERDGRHSFINSCSCCCTKDEIVIVINENYVLIMIEVQRDSP